MPISYQNTKSSINGLKKNLLPTEEYGMDIHYIAFKKLEKGSKLLQRLKNHKNVHNMLKHHTKYELILSKDDSLVVYTRLWNGHTEYSI